MSLFYKILLKILIAIVVFSSVRLALFIVHYQDFFIGLDKIKIVTAFLYGIKFDLSAAMTFCGFPLLMMLLPYKVFYKKSWQKFWSWVYFGILSFLLLVLLSDLMYFSVAKRHMFDEILSLRNDVSFIVNVGLSNYLLPLLLFAFGVIVCGALWKRLIDIPTDFKKYHVAGFVLLIIFLFVSIRGSLSKKPISIVDAFLTEDSRQGQLVLNGVFTSWQASLNWDAANYTFYSDEKLKAIMAKESIDTEKKYPFLKTYHTGKKEKKKLNIIIFLMESWGSYYVDSFGGKGFKSTPHFDDMSNNGLKFTNIYSHGTRSIEGIQATLTSFPALKGLPDLGVGLELMNLARIGSVFKSYDYSTYFMQSAARRSFRLDAISSALGFTHYFGAEDYPKKLDYKDETEPQFGWDYEPLMFLSEKLNSEKNHFIAFFYSGTSHTPYRKAPIALYPKEHGTENELGFLNTVYYSDWCLKQFMERAKKAPWFDDTVFVFAADHVFMAFRKMDFIEQYKIPLLIYSPKYLKPDIITKVGSHLDIMPTIIDILGIDETMSFVGSSLLNENEKGFAWISGRYGNPSIITKEGYLRHTLLKSLEKKSFNNACQDECFLNMEEKLLGLNQLIFKLMKTNQWSP